VLNEGKTIPYFSPLETMKPGFDLVRYNRRMLRKTVKISNLEDHDEIKDNLEYWLSKSCDERVEAVNTLRRQMHGNTIRFQRTARIIQLPQG